MKATELRIGNLVEETHSGEFGKVDMVVLSIIERMSNHSYIPIPLTKKWLVRLKDDGSFKLRFIKSIAAFEVQRKYVGIESGEEWIFISNVRYVHEWQNLYHALTGEELELKP